MSHVESGCKQRRGEGLNNAGSDGTPVIIKNCNSRVIKGGAWYYLPKVARSASRARNDDRVFSYVVGVRIAREIK